MVGHTILSKQLQMGSFALQDVVPVSNGGSSPKGEEIIDLIKDDGVGDDASHSES